MAEDATLETLGTQKVTAWGVILFAASALITGACTWVQLGPTLGLLIGVAGLFGAIKWYSGRGKPCFTVETGALVQHVGGHRKRYEWARMRRPVRLKRQLFQNFLSVHRDRVVPLLIPVDDLSQEERERLLEITTSIVCGGPGDPAEGAPQDACAPGAASTTRFPRAHPARPRSPCA